MSWPRLTFVDVRLVVDSTRLFVPGGDVYQWSVKVSQEIKSLAITYAPPTRSHARRGSFSHGHLRSTIRKSTRTAGPRQVTFEVSAHAVNARGQRYDQFVHEGTAYQGYRYIYSDAGWAEKPLVDSYVRYGLYRLAASEWWMPIPPIGYALRVHGQRANPFITDAYTDTTRIHDALPKKRFKHTF